MPFAQKFPNIRRSAIAFCIVAAIMLSASAPLASRASAFAAQRSANTSNANIPAPADVVGFTPGEDRKLASWSRIVDYFKRLDSASDRVMVQELGRTTLDRPFLLAIISSPANLAKLDRYREIQRRLADPRTINNNDAEAEKLIAEGRAIVMITFGIHSTEVGSNLVSMNIAHKLASDDSSDTLEILDKCIVLLVPSLNPDGVDIVKNWYDKTLGTPAEGTGPPELYHHYVGHDNNRDWYAFTQVETQMTVDKAHNAWHPQIVHDVHQQGPTGTRFFIPPYVEPWEPNVPPLIQAGVNFMGSAMAKELVSEGKSGVAINAIYDAWTPARAYQHYHAGIRILSETASANLASPTDIPFDRLRPQVNVDPKVRSWNFPLVWPGGEWRLADIVSYMQSGAFALMRNAARYRERWLRDFYKVGKDAVRERKSGEPFAFLIPPQPEDQFWRRYGLARVEAILNRGDVEISRALSSFEVDGTRYPSGTRIVFLQQPYGAFAKTLLERQEYPDLREYPGGPPRRPYDVTAHTLPLLMGIDVARTDKPFVPPKLERVATTDGDVARVIAAGEKLIASSARLAVYKSHSASMDEGWTRWALDQFKGGVKQSSLFDAEVRAGNLRTKYDCIIIPEQGSQQIVNGLPEGRYPAEVAGGVGREGVESLKKFVEDGGTIITFNDASEFAIEHLGVQAKNALGGVSSSEFFCPGSILKIEFDANDPLAQGMPPLDGMKGKAIAWFERSPAFETTGDEARIVARYGDAKDVLLSGWLLGADKVAKRGAIVEAKHGRGRVIMFAFRPQYRGQTVATLPFIFNAIRMSAEQKR